MLKSLQSCPDKNQLNFARISEAASHCPRMRETLLTDADKSFYNSPGRRSLPMTPITTICSLLAIFYVVRILRRRLSSTLDNIPGPPPTSFLTGATPVFPCVTHILYSQPPSPGNLTEYHDPDGWEFQRKLEQNYGRVVRFQGLLGVRKWCCLSLHS
jgi:hypothetical protein